MKIKVKKVINNNNETCFLVKIWWKWQEKGLWNCRMLLCTFDKKLLYEICCDCFSCWFYCKEICGYCCVYAKVLTIAKCWFLLSNPDILLWIMNEMCDCPKCLFLVFFFLTHFLLKKCFDKNTTMKMYVLKSDKSQTQFAIYKYLRNNQQLCCYTTRTVEFTYHFTRNPYTSVVIVAFVVKLTIVSKLLLVNSAFSQESFHFDKKSFLFNKIVFIMLYHCW